jgi:uncharacterized membrane protein
VIAQVSIPKFAALWLPALAISATADPTPRLADAFTFDLVPGLPVPALTCAIGAIGVLCARPLARRSESTLSWPMFALVSLIMLITAQLWIVEDRPGLLFAFVVSLGLGFAGYSLIEMVGAQVAQFARDMIGRAASAAQGKDGDGAA